MRVVQLSDTHLCAAGGLPLANLRRLAEFIGALEPDLIVHTGDVVAASPDRDDDRVAAADALACLTSLGVPLRILPGNHDVGEPVPDPWMGLGTTSERVIAHRDAFGPDRFLELTDGWALIGIDSELIGSGLPEEDGQWAWLEGALAQVEGRRLLLFSHKPLWPVTRSGPSPEALNLPDAGRERLLAAAGDRLAAVASGHLHRHRRRVRGTVAEVWAPAVGFMGREGIEPLDLNQLGVVEWNLDEDGARSAFRAPLGLDERPLERIPELMAILDELAPAVRS